MMRSLTTRLARKLFSGSKKPSRKLTFRPQIESLEQREVLSTSSPAPHAVLPTPVGGPAVEEVFYIQKSNGGLYFGEYDASEPSLGGVQLNGGQGPQRVQALSAGIGTNGNADVFAEAGDGSLWEYTAGISGWKQLTAAHQVESFAAVEGGRVFAIFSNGTLQLYTPTTGWSKVPTPGTVKALDAVTNTRGLDTVYVLNGDDSFGEVSYLPPLSVTSATTAKAASTIITPPPVSTLRPVYTQLLPTHYTLGGGYRRIAVPAVVSFSAGTNASGNADVYATLPVGVFDDPNLYQNLSNTPTGWTLFAADGAFTAYSAVNQGEVWIQGPRQVLSYGGLAPGVALYGPNGQRVFVGGYEVALAGQFTALSGLGAGGALQYSLFAVETDGDLLAFSSFGGSADLGSPVVA